MDLRRRLVARFPICFLVAASLALAAAFLAFACLGGGARAVGEPPRPVRLAGEYSVDGGPWLRLEPGVPFATDGRHTVVLRGRLSEAASPGEALLFYVRNLYVTLKINGAQVYAFGDPGGKAAFATPGIALASVPLEGLDAGGQLEFTIVNAFRNTVPSVPYLLDSLALGHASQYYLCLLKDGPVVLLSVFVALLGLIVLLLALVAKLLSLADAPRLAALGLFALATGLWVLFSANNYVLPLLVPLPKLAAGMDILSLYLMSAAALLLVHTYTSPPYRRVTAALLAAHCGALSLLLALQLMGAVQLYELQRSFILFTLLCAAGLGLLAADALKNKRPETKLLLLALSPALAGAALETINYFRLFLPRYLAATVGFSATLCLMLALVVHGMKRRSEAALESQALERRVLESNTAVMLSQIQPHFLFNVLVSIQQLCLKDPKEASRAIAGFAHYLRGNLDSLSGARLIPLERELDHVRAYLTLEEIRNPALRVRYDTEVTGFMLPPLSVQPLVENAVRHGVSRRAGGKGMVAIRTAQTEAHWLVVVADNGAGFLPSQAAADGVKHLGIENVRARLAALCGGTLEIFSAPGVGTLAQIQIPKRKDMEAC